MAKFAGNSVLDGGSDVIRTLAGTAARVKMHVVKAYTAGDSYATVTGNSCGSADLVAGDLVQSSNGSNRRTTVGANAITLTASSGATPNLHIAIVDSTGSAVLLVTDETSDQVLTSGGTFNVPAWTYDVNQPT
ncbi:MAG: hypothetical protein ACSLE9_11050 [Burkholderiaceae bacterium]